LLDPRIEANRLAGLPDCYKIKLRSSGYRLVYQVVDDDVVVFVVAVDKRERGRHIARLLIDCEAKTGKQKRPTFR